MAGYVPPTRDMQFLLKELIGTDYINKLPSYDEFSNDLVDAVLEEAGRFASGVLDPLNHPGDRQGAQFINNKVSSPEGFREAYQKFCESGWPSIANEEAWGGQGLPRILSAQTSEMWNAACMSFCLCPMLSAGVVHALSMHGTDDQKAVFLPNLVSGKWTGTMQLTEPQAGSDLSAVSSRAEPENDYYRITGNKIYITWGEHDMVDNIIHLVLARTPNAPEGVKGISLFIVPKVLVNKDGSLGERNDVRCVSIENKLGIHASPTCVMSYGDQGGAIGYMVGQENLGLQYMFTMMNFARLEVGIEGMALSDRAYQKALDYSKERIQGRDLDNPRSGERVPIISHPDVRRMLMTMKAQSEAMRALCALTCAHLDYALHDPEPERKAYHQAMFDLLTPVVKGWCTEQSVEITSLGVQIHGGMGFIEETGAAQYFRDARITPIYEGTTGIQANDLIGRKIAFEGGHTINLLISEMESMEQDFKKLQEDKSMLIVGRQFANSLRDLKDSVIWLVDTFKVNKKQVFAGSVPFLKLMGTVVGGWQMAKSAIIANQALARGTEDRDFYEAKVVTSRFYCEHVLPMSSALKKEIVSGADTTLLLKESQF